ncbi:MAG TPA: hypothetical protein VGL39_27830 [Jatrophihabitantaceae bacterium]
MKHNLTPSRTLRGRLIVGVLAAAAIAAVTLGGVAASAGPSDPTYHSNGLGFHACVKRDGSSRLYNNAIYLNTSGHATCPAGYAWFAWDQNGGGVAGPQGPAGPTGAQGDPAPAPTVASVDVAGTTLPAIGGSWTAGHVNLGSKDLAAGTYLVAVTGDFYKAAHTDATPVLQIQVNGLAQQVTAYTGAFPADAAEGVGLAADGTPNGLEQTASGYATIVVPAAGATAELDAFGYNPDRSGTGGGAFGVITHATFTKVG